MAERGIRLDHLLMVHKTCTLPGGRARVYIPRVRPLTRSVAVALMLVLLQLVLVESGYACRMPAGGAMQESRMAAMQMPGSPSLPSAPSPRDESSAPCRFPWAPAGCQAMSPCVLPALTVATTTIATFTLARMVSPPLAPLVPASLRQAPEPPPPRA